jgi:hypothetical protein
VHFKRWQVKITLWLTAINAFWLFEGKLEGQLTAELEKAYGEANTIFVGAVIRALAYHM